MVDLRGQFLHGTRAQAAADGTVAHQCVPKVEAATEK
jgi:hypothetical protein